MSMVCTLFACSLSNRISLLRPSAWLAQPPWLTDTPRDSRRCFSQSLETVLLTWQKFTSVHVIGRRARAVGASCLPLFFSGYHGGRRGSRWHWKTCLPVTGLGMGKRGQADGGRYGQGMNVYRNGMEMSTRLSAVHAENEICRARRTTRGFEVNGE